MEDLMQCQFCAEMTVSHVEVIKAKKMCRVPVAYDATVNELFKALAKLNLPIKPDGWMITNPITKEFIYNPTFEQAPNRRIEIDRF